MPILPHSPASHEPDAVWLRVAAQVTDWAAAQGLALRDVVVLVPFVQLLGPARNAFASQRVWMPRVETTRTLAATLAPPPPPPAGAPTGDLALDTWAARAILAPRRDWFTVGIDLEAAADDVARLAASIARALHGQRPPDRAARIASAQALLGPRAGPGADERLLGRIALDWAALAAAPTDVLWTFAPAGWVVVRVGGADALADALVGGGAPSLTIDLDEAVESLDVAHAAVVAAADFEQEAQEAAAEVIAAVADGARPVALIAQDRTTARRVRALLDSRGLSIADETGWRLSTTRAAATLGALLDAAEAEPPTDALLDAMKSVAAWVARPDWTGIERLEAECRRARLPRLATASAAAFSPAARAAHDIWRSAVAPLLDAAPRPLGTWLDALRGALQATGAWPLWSADAAGAAVMQALGMEPDSRRGRALREAMDAPVQRHALRRWIDTVLESESFIPPAPVDPDVVILPLERAPLRAFHAAVFPGADERRLDGSPAPWPLIGEAVAAALGLPDAATRLRARDRAFHHLLRLPRLVWLHRRQDGTESIAPSAWVEAALARGALRRAGRRVMRRVDVAPVRRSAPNGARLMPMERLSATAAEALRDCPYRFFALRLLRLREVDELDDEVQPRDFGSWMHGVLLRFHTERREPEFAELEVATLLRIAAEERERTGLPASAFVAHDAAFQAFAPRYIEWLHARDAQGWRFEAGEREVRVQPPALAPIAMYGEIDRIDRGPDGVALIDYKTGSADKLAERVRDPFEDTQLAFYAALLAASGEGQLQAQYLPLEGSKALKPIVHADVARSAEALVQGLGAELQRIAQGEPLQPLGEGAACSFCAARGLCRRDHWTA